MARRNRGGMDDYEAERYLEEIEERRRYGDDTVLYVIIGLVVGGALIYAGLGWADNQFGWSTLDWFKDLLNIKK